MSASLVGSEMCIRDRFWMPGDEPADLPGRHFARWQPAGGGARPRRAGPVSYTHLTLPTICSV
eukprot:10365520-Alexandrium_andersonii.AAC.1